jgi:hypothetical protein
VAWGDFIEYGILCQVNCFPGINVPYVPSYVPRRRAFSNGEKDRLHFLFHMRNKGNIPEKSLLDLVNYLV